MSATPNLPRPNRFRQGWREATKCWSLVRHDPKLLTLPGASLLCVLAGGAVIAALVGASGIGADFRMKAAIWALLGAYPLTLLSTFFGVAFATMADGRLRGHETTAREGLAAARGRIGVIAKWALLASGVGVLLQALQQVRADWAASPLLSWLAGAAWTIITFFVLPILAFEQVGVRDAARRSASIVKQRWGEQVAGMTNVGVVFAVIAFPVFLVGSLAAGFAMFAAPGAAVAIWAAVALAFAASLVAMTAAGQLLSLVLYRYATEGELLGEFTDADLERAARPKRLRLRRARRDGGA